LVVTLPPYGSWIGGFAEKPGCQRWARTFSCRLIGTSWCRREHLPGMRARATSRWGGVRPSAGSHPERPFGDGRQVPLAGRTRSGLAEISPRRPSTVLVVARRTPCHNSSSPGRARPGGAARHLENPCVNWRWARDMAARAEAGRSKTLTFLHAPRGRCRRLVKRLVGEGFMGTPAPDRTFFSASHLRPCKSLIGGFQRPNPARRAGGIGSHLIDWCAVGWRFPRALPCQWQTVLRERSGEWLMRQDCSFLAAAGLRRAGRVFHAASSSPAVGNYQLGRAAKKQGSLTYEADPGYSPPGRPRVRWPALPAAWRRWPCLRPDRRTGPLPTPGRPHEAYRRLTDPFFAAIPPAPGLACNFRDGARVQGPSWMPYPEYA